METNVVQIPGKQARANIFAIVVIILLVIGVGWYAYHKNQKQSKSNSTTLSIPATWSTYKNDQYSFQLKYPTNWGAASLKTFSAQGGNSYIVNFSKTVKTGSTFYAPSVSFSPGNKSLAKDAIQKQIDSASKNKKIITDSSSYAQVNNSASLELSTLQLYQIVNLPKLNTTGALLMLQIPNANPKCPVDELSNLDGCVSKSDYTTLNMVAKSIQSF